MMFFPVKMTNGALSHLVSAAARWRALRFVVNLSLARLSKTIFLGPACTQQKK
jgi:hypothetical protein